MGPECLSNLSNRGLLPTDFKGERGLEPECLSNLSNRGVLGVIGSTIFGPELTFRRNLENSPNGHFQLLAIIAIFAPSVCTPWSSPIHKTPEFDEARQDGPAAQISARAEGGRSRRGRTRKSYMFFGGPFLWGPGTTTRETRAAKRETTKRSMN